MSAGIALSRIERLVYAAASPRYGFCRDREWVHNLYDKSLRNITIGVCEEEARALIKNFFENRRTGFRAD